MANTVSCIYCGRFIGHKEFDSNAVSFHFTPDSEFTTESIDYFHVVCRPPNDPPFVPHAFGYQALQ